MKTGHLEKLLTGERFYLSESSAVDMVADDPGNTISFIIKNVEYFVPVGDMINPEEEAAKLEIELEYSRGFLASVQKKLSNDRFVQNAPETVVEKERQKAADAEEKIKAMSSRSVKSAPASKRIKQL